MTPPVKSVLVSSNFPPMPGGSGVVYENLARLSCGAVTVLAANLSYHDGHEFHGWRARDAEAHYEIKRRPLLRPRVGQHRRPLDWLRHVVVSNLWIRLRVLWRLWRLVRRHGAKVVLIGELDAGGWLIRAVHAMGLKAVVYTHGDEVATVGVAEDILARRRRYVQIADAVCAVSRFNRETLVSRLGMRPERIELIFNGVDLERFRPRPKDPALLRRYGLEGAQVLATISRLIERKGVDKTLEALPLIIEKVPNVKYLIVGDGPYRSKLEQLARQLGLQDHVVFTGGVPHDYTARYYGLADIFVMPNRELADGNNEGFGLVFLEANACGKPVVAGNAGGATDAVTDGENGLVVDGRDVQAIADAVLRLLTDKSLYERISRTGLERAAQSSWSSRVDQFHRLCHRLLAA